MMERCVEVKIGNTRNMSVFKLPTLSVAGAQPSGQENTFLGDCVCYSGC